MKILMLILIFSGAALIDIPGLLKNKQWGELITASSLLAIGFVLSLLLIIGVKIPNPNKGIQKLIESLF